MNENPDAASDVFDMSSKVNILFRNHDSNITPNLSFHTLDKLSR